MSCDDVRQALPLLAGTDPEHAARVRAHAMACEPCGELLRAFDADERVLGAARHDRRVPAGALDGFTAQVMRRIEEEKRARRVTPSTRPSGAPDPAPSASSPSDGGGLVLRPVFLRVVAAAAAVALAVGLGLTRGTTPAGEADERVGPSQFAVAPVPEQRPVEPLPVVDPVLVQDRLPAPRLERDPAPMPMRRRGGAVVPVDGGSGRRAGRQPRLGGGQQGGELIDLLDKVLPNLHQRMMKELGEEQGREVRF